MSSAVQQRFRFPFLPKFDHDSRFDVVMRGSAHGWVAAKVWMAAWVGGRLVGLVGGGQWVSETLSVHLPSSL